jgi:hypothetical protein
MTAVEWLLENLNSEPYSEEEFNYNSECWDKAKEMERGQIIDSYRDGRSDQQSDRPSKFYNRMAEQYYKETYESNT